MTLTELAARLSADERDAFHALLAAGWFVSVQPFIEDTVLVNDFPHARQLINERVDLALCKRFKPAAFNPQTQASA